MVRVKDRSVGFPQFMLVRTVPPPATAPRQIARSQPRAPGNPSPPRSEDLPRQPLAGPNGNDLVAAGDVIVVAAETGLIHHLHGLVPLCIL